MPLDWSPLVAMIRRNQKFLLMTHVRPDADGLGSQIALADALEALGKQVRITIASRLPPRYEFLDRKRTLIQDFRLPGEEFRDVDCVIVMDTGTWNQLGEFGPFLKTLNCEKAVVDHHRTQDDLGAVPFIDVTAEATGRLTFEILRALDVSISPRAAHHMFMALALDTGWFRHSNTTAASFALADELVRLGANPTPLYEQLFECAPLARLKLVGTALQRLTLRVEGKIAFTEVYLDDYSATGAVPGDTEDLINYPRAIDGVEVAMLFIEQPEGGTKVSFRSRSRVDVSRIAEQFGGGGHKLASGTQVMDTLANVRDRVLAVVESAVHAMGDR